MTNHEDHMLDAARHDDADAFSQLIRPHRAALHAHCYRMLGSLQDAEDALQETLLNAWRSLHRFEGRSSLKSWIYRIATNACLKTIERRPKRVLPIDYGPAADPHDPLTAPLVESVWLEPYPDVLLEGIPDEAPGPEARYETKEAIALAFIVGLQYLPPQQRAVLVLRDVLGYRAGEVAEMLETTEASANSLLRRARAAFESRLPATERERAPLPNSKLERDIVGRFAETVENGDIDAMVALLTDDAWVTMPPLPHAYQGHKAITAFLRGSAARRGAPLRLVATRANGQPAFGCYLPVSEADVARAYALFVLTLAGDQKRIAAAKHRDPFANSRRPVANLERRRRAGQDLRPDRRRIFGARIVVGNDRHVGAARGDFAHDRSLARIAVAAATEHQDEAPTHEWTQRGDRLRERVGLMRVVDKDRRAVEIADAFEASGRAFQCFQRFEDSLRLAARGDAKAGGDQRVGNLKVAGQRKAYAKALTAELKIEH